MRRPTQILFGVLASLFYFSEICKPIIPSIFGVDIVVVSILLYMSVFLVYYLVQYPGVGMASFGILAVFVVVSLTFLTGPSNDYGQYKVAGFLLLTMPAAFVSSIILRSSAAVYSFASVLVVLGIVMAVGAMGEGLSASGRLASYTSSSLVLGRGWGGAAVVCLAFATTQRRWWRVLLFAAAILFSALIVATGNRQGILGVVAASSFLIYMSLVSRSLIYRVGYVVVFVVLGYVLFGMISDFIPSVSLDRYQNLLSGNDRSAEVRIGLYAAAMRDITLFGHGWGSFYDLGFESRGIPILYPHNILLETLYESGVVSFILVSAMFAISLRLSIWSYIKYRRTSMLVVSMMLIYYIVVSLISGDMYSNRTVFGVASVALALSRAYSLEWHSVRRKSASQLFPYRASV